MEDTLKHLLVDDVKPNHLKEIEWLMDYMKKGSPNGEAIFLSLGETWQDTPQKLIELFSKSPKYTHGYQMSMYGYPPLRRKAKLYIEKQNNLNIEDWYNHKKMYEVAVGATGTRAAMYDFACLLKEEISIKINEKIYVIVMSPGWGYDSLFSALGYEVIYIRLLPENGFEPDLKLIIKTLEDTKKLGETVFPLNTQHNPTGINWSDVLVKKIIEKAIDLNIALLLDDAYFNVCNGTPTSSLQILLKTLVEKNNLSFTKWLYVHSLGKQFSCNGWGVGIVAAAPKILDKMMNSYQVRHHYNINAPFQFALSEYLDTEDSKEYIKSLNKKVHHNRIIFLKRLTTELCFPLNLFPKSVCTSFQLFPIPRKYHENGGSDKFIKDLMEQGGVLFTDAWPTPDKFFETANRYNYARIYLGVETKLIMEAVDRMKKMNVVY